MTPAIVIQRSVVRPICSVLSSSRNFSVIAL